MKPVVDRLKQRYAGKVDVRQLNADEAGTQELANRYGIQYVPTFVFVDKAGKRVDQVVGEISEQDLAKKLDSLQTQ